MGKMSAYRQSKQRERAKELALETGITFDEAMTQIELRHKAASETLTKMAKSKRKEAKIKRKEAKIKKDEKRKKTKETQFEKFQTKVTPGAFPVQGGSPGLGKK
jgi:hypothetical protein